MTIRAHSDFAFDLIKERKKFGKEEFNKHIVQILKKVGGKKKKNNPEERL